MDQPGKGSFRQAGIGEGLLWPEHSPAGLPLRYQQPPATARRAAAPDTGFGLERRLPRRAETMWEQLATATCLPSSVAATQFLRKPYLGHSMQLRRRPDGSVEIETIGEGLQSNTQLGRGRYRRDDSSATELGHELVELGRAALARAAPLRLESEQMARQPGAGRPHLLLRAVALPFANDAAGDALAVVVASWRKLLSAEETAILHRELAAAMDWMHRQRPRE